MKQRKAKVLKRQLRRRRQKALDCLKNYSNYNILNSSDQSSISKLKDNPKNLHVKVSADYENLEDGIELLNTSPYASISEELTVPDTPNHDNENNKELNFEEFLKSWAINFNISHSALDCLLPVLNNHIESDLPNTAKTLLHTPKNKVNYTSIVDGKCMEKFSYFGIKKAMIYFLNEGAEPCLVKDDWLMTFKFNFDGLSIASSKNISMWPILALPFSSELEPFLVALYTIHGKSKPSSLELYLDEFIQEGNDLHTNGFLYNDRVIKLDLSNSIFCADAPARSFLKCTKGHTSYFSCDVCHQEGDFVNQLVFDAEINPRMLRTDETFRQKIHPEHHQIDIDSPLLQLPIDMIFSFPADYMHLCLLGICKRLIKTWTQAKYNKFYKLNKKNQQNISISIENLNKFLPTALFNRAVQNIELYNRWKATECRTFLLYFGQFCLKDQLKTRYYNNFMLFSIAIYIMCSPLLLSKYLPYANTLIQKFVKDSQKLYGVEFISYNCHLLLHLPLFVKKYGCLDAFSCFPFESFMYKIKKMIRSGKDPHQQVIRRYEERLSLSSHNQISRNSKRLLLDLKKVFIIIEVENKNNYMKVTSYTELNDTIYASGYYLDTPIPLWNYPWSSEKFGIVNGMLSKIMTNVEIPSLRLQVALCIPHNNGFAAIPLTHTN